MYDEFCFFLQNKDFFLHFFLFVEINFTSQNRFFLIEWTK